MYVLLCFSRAFFNICIDLLFFFFFKQKTAYEMLRSLVGSEMCIRDRPGNQRSLVPDGQAIVVEIAVTEAKPQERQSPNGSQ